MRNLAVTASCLVTCTLSSAAISAETVTYGYDARGRLVRVVRSGGPNNGAVTIYEHDRADNRKRVQTAGATH